MKQNRKPTAPQGYYFPQDKNEINKRDRKYIWMAIAVDIVIFLLCTVFLVGLGFLGHEIFDIVRPQMNEIVSEMEEDISKAQDEYAEEMSSIQAENEVENSKSQQEYLEEESSLQQEYAEEISKEQQEYLEEESSLQQEYESEMSSLKEEYTKAP